METPEDGFFRVLADAHAEARQAFARHVGMSESRLRLLMWLRNNGETSHSDLRQSLSLDGATVTRLVEQFEARGAVGCRVDPRNNHYTLARPTPAGESTAAELARAHRVYMERLLHGVTPQERQTALGVPARMSANATRVAADPAG
ncbi:MarR family winged helix-turn-helix transcriptional regulator [Embleya scabrispora]|uniref:MarR family winged helix-turn-helix transcriptional regulator n=1 Tax=Embleya scabrispora TaxID=159449 RepID=UPI00036C7AB5|nr:MarR family winged helix-turn-helix transcriptional regulator [Embleya scabrispora]MYS84627.1 MarR family transcriptional regulator [Streptomyces sp. SID5474]